GFFGKYTQALGGTDVTISFDVVPAVLISMIVVWLAVIIVMALGVQKGIAASSIVFIPLQLVMFVILVVRHLFLPLPIDGLAVLCRAAVAGRVVRGLRPDLLLSVRSLRHHAHLLLLPEEEDGPHRLRPGGRLRELRLRDPVRHRRVLRAGLHGAGAGRRDRRG